MEEFKITTNFLSNYLLPLLEKLNVDPALNYLIYHATALVIILLIAFLSFQIAYLILSNQLNRLITKTKAQWDDSLKEHGFFHKVAHTIPAIFINLLNNNLFTPDSTVFFIVDVGAVAYLILALTSAGNAALNTVQDSFNRSNLSQRIPIDGFIQVGKLLLAVLALLLITAKALDKSPALLLSGLGAITAILLLVFKDTILGFVAGINIVANRTVNNGDWIEMPKYGADGTVLALGLTTVKIKNWDNTISTVPTYALMNDAVKNWRGMEESGGRRIKRAIYIDAQTIKMADQNFLTFLENQSLLAESPFEESVQNSQTNLGLLRNYMYSYLKNHPMINRNLTLLVRQLAPSEVGVPVEIYCFSSDKRWAYYEAIQAEIIEHFIAMLPRFELRMFQRISDKPEQRRFS